MFLLDGEDRLLLFRFPRVCGRPDSGHCWITPGGGVDSGEALHEAAARELREETGLIVAPAGLGPVVAMSSGYADLGWSQGVFRDDFFFHRVSVHEVDDSGWEEAERNQISAHRWWRVDELMSTTEIVYPLGLAPLLADLVAGRLPAEPVELPWHH